jgi:CMP-N,N'-diacetyllegionaminic acid synthase
MHKNKRILAVITARGGSKGIPGKNIKLLQGKPLLAYSIETALKVKAIDKVIVSSESEEIIRIAKEYGAQAPFVRPQALAQDNSPTFGVLEHASTFLKTELNEDYDYLCLLEPTAPLRTVQDVENAIMLLIDTPGAEAVVGISEASAFHPSVIFGMDERCFLRKAFNNIDIGRRQELGRFFYPNAALYISEMKALLNRKTFYHEKTIGYLMPKYRAIEIDELEDFLINEAILNYGLDKFKAIT